jgi:hypothetical protein
MSNIYKPVAYSASYKMFHTYYYDVSMRFSFNFNYCNF